MRMSTHLLYILSLSQCHFSWLCWETVSLESYIWMRLLRRRDCHHLRVMLGGQAVGKHVESKDNSCFKWYFQKVLPRPMNPLLLRGQCCFGFHQCSLLVPVQGYWVTVDGALSPRLSTNHGCDPAPTSWEEVLGTHQRKLGSHLPA